MSNEREQLIESNKELMVLNADYEDLKRRLFKLGKKIFEIKTKIDNKLNGEGE